MKLYSSNDSYKLYHGNMLDMLEVIEPNSIDSIVCDPPYGLTSITKRFGKENSAECKYGKDGSFQRLSKGFMGKEWDGSGIEYNIDAWKKCYEVLKPGGYLLAFGGSRTYHRIACAIEDAGFEIRDTIMWLYGSGFPKSMDISKAIDKKFGAEREIIGISDKQPAGFIRHGRTDEEVFLGTDKERQPDYITEPFTQEAKQWQGWGTALKPSFEPIIVARKPVEGTVVNNVLKWGVGGINIDECRVGNEEFEITKSDYDEPTNNAFGHIKRTPKKYVGRFPANTILTYDETDFEEVCGGFPHTKGDTRTSKPTYDKSIWGNAKSVESNALYNDSGSAARYFYCAKASKKDRDEGLDMFEEKPKTLTENKGRTFNDRCAICGKKFIGSPETICHCENPITDKTKSAMSKNTHPTVKSTNLMQYLVRLVTPKNGTILDCFMGSGSTGKAVMFENREREANYKFIGIELTEEYLPICEARIDYALNKYEYDFKKELNEAKEMGQQNIFDLIGVD